MGSTTSNNYVDLHNLDYLKNFSLHDLLIVVPHAFFLKFPGWITPASLTTFAAPIVKSMWKVASI